MKVNAKIRYGVQAILDIALFGGTKGVLQKEIAARTSISNKYLDHIISGLKSANLIMNTAGKKSGYILAKQPNAISLYDIYCAFESEINIVPCVQDKNQCDCDQYCAPMEYWAGINQNIVLYMKKANLKEITDKQKALNNQKNNVLSFEI